MKVIMNEAEIKEHKADKAYHDQFMIIREADTCQSNYTKLNNKGVRQHNAAKRSNPKE